MGDAAEQAKAEEQGGEEGGGKSKLPLIIGGLAVFLIIVIVVAFMLLGSGDSTNAPAVKTPIPPGYNYTFPQPFVTLLAPPDDQYLLSVNITLELKPRSDQYSEAQMLEEMGVETENPKNRMAQIKDKITEILATKTRLEITGVGGRANIRNEIRRAMNDILQYGEVMNVYLDTPNIS